MGAAVVTQAAATAAGAAIVNNAAGEGAGAPAVPNRAFACERRGPVRPAEVLERLHD